ncbi:MAG: chemotaxis protein CheD [Bacillus sp. (in: Bacteria)]|uniref:chemotaxis protein CheD n=1 Tax=Bacillus TaxID=1386 RepID=UPI0004042666|nr:MULTISPECIES: chemotaxis protein CheD [Bacillus]MBW4887966.1 chemotaxis protein CheD [Bacillus sp. (in: firmicutes)]MCJ8224450.1 chemotaxis protein CheD [Bacillus paralicheniformis]MCW4366781.1 chemotaxis protein CheD [Bacillus paralicheniformis]MEC1824814.1 chemotaxis protein CheD [Bacillus paralicheniformis]TWK28561.1 Chemoreceptor glutamine deamidase CheD [Bacillus paralicheniformis]
MKILEKETSIIRVGIADVKIVRTPDKIRTSGLGSCVGLVLYDLEAKTAGLVHVMLPDSSLSKTPDINVAKYADTAVEATVKMLLEAGCRKYALKAKMAGGAEMFKFKMTNDLMKVGPRNVLAIKKHLSLLNIPIVSEDTGGNSGRTIEFDPQSAELVIRTVKQGVTMI